MLSGVTVSCFLFSYLLALVWEAVRLIGKRTGRTWITVFLLIAGLVAHASFLYYHLRLPDAAGAPLAINNWFQWSMAGSFILAILCFLLILRNPQTSVSLFLLPVVLSVTGIALVFGGSGSFGAGGSAAAWRWIHGISLLIATVFISLGAAFGAMYLVQSGRLKRRPGGQRKLRLPALEFLQRMNRWCLFATAVALAVGFVSGILLQLQTDQPFRWWEGGIVATAALFLWSSLAAMWEVFSTGSMGGRRVARLVVANFLLLVVVLTALMVSSHGLQEGRQDSPTGGQQAGEVPR
ncbi:MAG: cytochrome c assembly protein [Pirellulaceae bacterium]|nr:MAG: cytochrome c assembly protein [Pirellulaceae bacterium]